MCVDMYVHTYYMYIRVYIQNNAQSGILVEIYIFMKLIFAKFIKIIKYRKKLTRISI